MYFKRLEMHGFKSFAEPAVIEFHEGVTCIVGPNGSGKSNISDAIRWVLGEQSPKMLRGSKMEEVIFSGTANRKSRGMAEVTLVIDNTEGSLPIDYNEVAITRRMYRSGESEYLINNNQCRLRDIRELIMDTGIGVEGYSIIGQGKIADIVSNKPESRRQVFEEAAGVVMYKSKKAESERKLASASANLERVNDIIAEIESRIDGLKEDSIKAEEYLALRKRFKELEINITLRNIEKLDSSNQAIKDDLSVFAEEIEKLSAEKTALDKDYTEARQKSENLDKLGNEARDKLLSCVEEINSLTNKSQLDTERLNTLDRDFARVRDELKTLGEKRDRETEAEKELRLQEAEISASLEKTEKELGEKIDAYTEVSEKAAELAKDIDESRNKMYLLYNESSAKRSEAKSMESYKESLKKRREQLIEERKRLDETREASSTALNEAEKNKAEIEEKLHALKEQTKTNRIELENLSAKAKELDKQSSHAQILISQYNTRKKTIEEMENNYEGYNNAVRFIMKGNFNGIEGVAADLMKVPEGFEVAVETALGAAMQNIVCQKDKDAKTAIQALKDNKAGRATFLPMESVKGSRANLPTSLSSAKGFRGLACDIIQCGDKYKGIFDYLLGRVVIVETMQDAIDCSKQKGLGVRFVTLEGEIVNISGAITGGKYKNNTANLLERKREIEKLAKDIKAIEDNLSKLQSEKKTLSDRSEKIRILIDELEKSYRNLEIESFNLHAKIESEIKSSKEMESNASRHVQQLASVEGDLDNADSMAKKLEEEALRCQQESEQLKAVIEELMNKQESVKAETDKASEDITAIRIEKNRQDSNKEGLMQMIQRIGKIVADFDSQIEAKKLQLQTFEEEKNNILFGSKDADEEIRDKNKEKEELEEYILRVSEEKADISVKEEEMNKRRTSLSEQLNSYQDKKYQQEIRIAKNETQLDTLKERLWDEFEISYLQAIEFKKTDFAVSTAQKESREIKNRLKELGDVNVGAIKEYAQVKERYEFLSEQRRDITSAMEQLKEIVDDMERTIKTKFKENFDKVVINFEEIFKALFGGGHAELRLDNEDNPLEAGIEIVAQPPGKKLQNINLMSGGEKTMTAMALMFAVLKTTPTPFCILDEVEAALDDNNIDRFAKYLRNFHDIQFAIVTHQKATMEHADVLYGVTMPEHGISKVLSLRLGDNFEL